MMESGVQRR